MALSKVEVILGNGNIGASAPSEDGTTAFMLTGVSVIGGAQVDFTYVVYSLAEAVELGIEAVGDNAFAYSHFADFYQMAPDGTPLYFMLISSTVYMAEMADLEGVGNRAKRLLDYAKGSVRLIGFSRNGSASDYEEGLDVDVANTMIKAQALCEYYAAANKPLRFVVDGREMDDIDVLRDYTEYGYNRGSIIIASHNNAYLSGAVGLYLGALAGLPVQRKVSRVKNGALPITAANFTNGDPIDMYSNQLESISNKGYVFFRTHVGLGGYYFSGDQAATATTDDYSSIARGRVIDKVHRLAYARFVKELDEDVDVDADGKIDAALVKSLQGAIENSVNTNMTNRSELSNFKAIIDPNQNVIAEERYTVQCQARPKGYSKIIIIELNYNNPAN